MAGGLREEPAAMGNTTALGVFGAVIQPAQPGETDRPCTHGTGLQGDVEVTTA